MGRLLNLVDTLLLTGRRMQQLGRTRDAFATLARLASFRELPAQAAEEAQARLGEIQLGRRKFGRARRHLAAALRHDPDNARYHHLLATALREQGEEHWKRAAEHYRRSLEIDPRQVECLAEFGLFAVRIGQADEGLRCLRDALALQPDDPELVGKLVKGLRLAGRWDEARSELLAALFRNPRDRRFRQLWDNFQFREVRLRQLAQRRRKRKATDDGPVLLPFVAAARPDDGKVIRHDAPTPLPSPHTPRPTRPAGRRHVQ